MELSAQAQRKLKKKTVLVTAAWLFGLATVYSFAVLPLLVYVQNDIVLDATAISVILEFLYPLIEVILLALGYGFSVYAIFEFGFRGALPVISLPVAVSLYKYLSNLIATYIMSKEPISIDYVYAVFYAFLEMVLLAIVVGIANKCISKHKEEAFIRKKGLKYLGKQDDTHPPLPFLKVVDIKNYLQKSMLIISIIMAALRVALRIRYDVFKGRPSGAKEIFTMIVYYIYDVLTMPISYIVMSLAVVGCYSLCLKIKKKEDLNLN